MISIAPYSEQKRAVVVSLLVQFQKDLSVHSDTMTIDPVQLEKYLDETLSHKGGFAFVVEENSESIGLLMGYIWESAEEIRPYLFISDLYVVMEKRGSGLGSELLKYADRHAKSLGLQEVRLMVLSENSRALKLYENTGYSELAKVMAKNL